MKICFYSASRSPLDILQGATTDRGGAEKQIAHLAKALAERGHEVYLLYSDEANNKHEPPDKISGVYCRKTNLETAFGINFKLLYRMGSRFYLLD